MYISPLYKICLVHPGGLVHRSNASSSSGGGATGGGAAEASGWGPPGAEKNPDLPDQEDDGYDDKNEDSKSMRLTLMEEVLLLGIKDREVGGAKCNGNYSVVSPQFLT